jgi:hypothetical protein
MTKVQSATGSGRLSRQHRPSQAGAVDISENGTKMDDGGAYIRKKDNEARYTRKVSIPEESRNSVESDTHERKGMLNEWSAEGLLAEMPYESTPSRLSYALCHSEPALTRRTSAHPPDSNDCCGHVVAANEDKNDRNFKSKLDNR